MLNLHALILTHKYIILVHILILSHFWYPYSVHSLLEGAEAEALQAQSSSSQYIQRVWTCPPCQQKMAVTLAKQLQHQAECKKHLEEMQAAAASQQAGPSSEALLL